MQRRTVSTIGAVMPDTGSPPNHGNTSFSSLAMTLLEWLSALAIIYFPNHSRATASKLLAAPSFPAAFRAFLTTPGSAAIGQPLPGFLAPFAGCRKAGFGVRAKGKPLFLALDTIFESPELATVWIDRKA
jgi:hypothetical protein